MPQNLEFVNVFPPSVIEIVGNIFISLVCSFFVSMIYRITYKGPGFSDSFVNSIIYLSVITTLVIMVIGNNLARAFGLVGALSIIRFRTAIKDTVDIVYIFLGLAIGMAAGVGYHKVAIIGTLIISAILYLFSKTRFSLFRTMQYMLQFNYTADNTNPNDHEKILNTFCRQYEMINLRTSDSKGIEYTYHISLKNKISSTHFVEELKKINGMGRINLFFDEQSS